MKPSPFSRIFGNLGVDQPIILSVLNIIRSMLGGPLIALLIALRFTPEEQGFYFTFSSVLALQVFAEMGLSSVILQFASHEWGLLALSASGAVEGDGESMSRLAGIVRFARRWYGIASIVTSFGLAMGGYLFFSHHPHSGISWAGPWVSLCVLTGVKLFLSPFFSILEGCGQMKKVYGYRLAEGLALLIVALCAIYFGAGLWTAVFATTVSIVMALLFLWTYYRKFYLSLLNAPISARVDWREEMLPMQWRIAVSWLCGYFTYQLFTPILFNYQGAAVAGQFGLVWSVVNAVSSISMVWTSTKLPIYGGLIARREYLQLDRLAKRAVWGSTAVAIAGSLAVLLGMLILDRWYPTIAHRFLSVGPCAILLAAAILTQLSYAQSAYLRAHKREPFLGLSIGASILTGASTWYFGSHSGPLEMALGFFLVVALFTLPVGTAIFLRCRTRWHSEIFT